MDVDEGPDPKIRHHTLLDKSALVFIRGICRFNKYQNCVSWPIYGKLNCTECFRLSSLDA